MALSPQTVTEREIFAQGQSLKASHAYVHQHSDAWRAFWRQHSQRRIIFTGCGSGYCLSQAAAEACRQFTGRPAEAIAGGDLLLNFPYYKERLRGALVITVSRSGSTSELVKSLGDAKQNADAVIVSIVAAKDTPLEKLSDFSLEMPWAYNESVCQTGTVTVFYTVILQLLGIAGGDLQLLSDLEKAVSEQDQFILDTTAALQRLTGWEKWANVVLLADGVAWGLVDEAAMAFREMACAPANCYHILDVRHGPTATIGNHSLVLLLATKGNIAEQERLVRELTRLGAFVITVGLESEASPASWTDFPLASFTEEAVRGIPFIFIAQWLACRSALLRGLNPDAPQNLTAWVKLP